MHRASVQKRLFFREVPVTVKHGHVSIQVSGSCLFDKVLHRSHIAPGFDLRSVLPVKKWIFFFRQAATAFPLHAEKEEPLWQMVYIFRKKHYTSS